VKLIQCERPGFVSYGRLANLRDELDWWFETPVRTWTPALDVQENRDHYSVSVELPGLRPEGIQVSLDEGALVISGERHGEKWKKVLNSTDWSVAAGNSSVP
jgi:HSP20 family molecular chaperone IbpA